MNSLASDTLPEDESENYEPEEAGLKAEDHTPGNEKESKWEVVTETAGVMTGAVATEVLLIPDGDPVTPMVLLVLAATVAWFRRDRTIALLENGRGRMSATRPRRV